MLDKVFFMLESLVRVSLIDFTNGFELAKYIG